MTAPALIKDLQLGRAPRVAGTIITENYLRDWSAQPRPLPCDLVELRVDGFSHVNGWLEIGARIEAAGTPVFATVRHAREGGQWAGDEEARRQLLNSALEKLSGIDVELHSDLAPGLAERARALNKLCILSFHDFQKTAPRAELLAILKQMQQLGSVAKIAATANSLDDVETLRSLLHEPWTVPVCLIGMGAHGRATRLSFPKEGSCLTYGYLDIAGAPGQFSAQELRDHFNPVR